MANEAVSMDYSLLSIDDDDAEDLVSGELTWPRHSVTASAVALATGSLRLTFFTAKRSQTINTIRIISGGTAAAATPTLVRMGIYKVDSNGNLTLIASTANDTTLFAGAFVVYSKSLSASWNMQKGIRYAFGLLVVSAVATPTFYGNLGINADISATSPRLAGMVNSLSDLPSTIAEASILNSNSHIYAELRP